MVVKNILNNSLKKKEFLKKQVKKFYINWKTKINNVW
jgi:hypothetical protein